MTRRDFFELLTASAGAALGVTAVPAASGVALPATAPGSQRWIRVEATELRIDTRAELFANRYPAFTEMKGSLRLAGVHRVCAGETVAVRFLFREWTFGFCGIVEHSSWWTKDARAESEFSFYVFRKWDEREVGSCAASRCWSRHRPGILCSKYSSAAWTAA